VGALGGARGGPDNAAVGIVAAADAVGFGMGFTGEAMKELHVPG
jgi:hypothetical protein